ncbi:MAG: hypothetical protein ACREBC_17345 [Pyrinomonadaceae bacterium]
MNESMNCPYLVCNATVYWYEERCSKCGKDVGFPNVREVGCDEERVALHRRYESALDVGQKRGAQDQIRAFASAVESISHAVINTWASYLFQFLNDPRQTYANYSLQTSAGTRRPASMGNDRNRRGTEGILFGHYAERIHHAALSLDGSALSSYGDEDCCFTIADVTADSKATVLQENSYKFIHSHTLLPGNEIPLGYRAVWSERHKLAVAKLAVQIDKTTPPSSFPGLLLYSVGNRDTDEYLEVHIYGSFDNQAVEAVKIPKPGTATLDKQADLKRIRDLARRNSKGYTEV